MFGGNDQPPPPPTAPLQEVKSSAGTPPMSTDAMRSKAAKAEGAGALETETPGVLTDQQVSQQTSDQTRANTKRPTGSLLGGS